MIEVKTNEWKEEVLNSEIPVLVDFWATWCVPCKMIGKILEKIGSDFEGKVKIVKLNADEEKEIAIEYGIRALPTLLIIKNGEIAEKVVGALSKGKLVKLLKKYS